MGLIAAAAWLSSFQPAASALIPLASFCSFIRQHLTAPKGGLFLTSVFRWGNFLKAAHMSIDEPRFSATVVADIIEAKPSEIRDWRDRGLARYVGQKFDHAVRYSIRDAAFLAITRDLIKLNFAVDAAAQAASVLLERVPPPEAVFRGTMAELASLVPAPADGHLFSRQSFAVPGAVDTRVEIPIGAIWARVLARVDAPPLSGPSPATPGGCGRGGPAFV